MNLDEIFTNELKLSDLDEEARNVILAQLAESLMMRIGARFVEELNADELSKLQAAIDQDSEEAMEVLSDRFPNFQDILQEEIDQITDEYKSLHS